MTTFLSPQLLVGGGVFLAGAVGAYFADQAFIVLLSNKWAIALVGGAAALGIYITIQKGVITSLPKAV